MKPKINRNIIIVILIVVILFFAGIIGWIFLSKEEKPFVPEEIIEEEKDIEEILQELTPTDTHPLTSEEQEEQEQLLKELTPTQPKPMTEEEQKELEEILEQLTPQ